jgi:Flp pilus assembly pilin Flp
MYWAKARDRGVRKGGEEQLDRIWKTLDMVDRFKERVGRASGQGLAEYALILALIAIVAIVSLLFLGGQISKILSNVGKSV